MEKRILLEKRGREANQIKELNLDNCRSTAIEGLTDEFTALEKLSLINVGLTSLKNFPKLPSLKKLELSDNRISNGLNHLLTSPKLTSLNLSGNKIKDFDELKPLASMEKLEVLDLFNNEVTTAENYRNNVLQLIPSLKFLDGFDKDDNEGPSDDDDEINGNESEDDVPDAFCVNGIEIDLKELEELEQRVAAKKLALASSEASTSSDCDKLEKEFEKSLKISDKKQEETLQTSSHQPSLASIFLVIMSIFSILNQIHYKPMAQKDEDGVEEEEFEEDDDDEEDDEPGLKDVYNEDLEEDNSDWNEAGEDEDEDDIDSDEDADETAEKVGAAGDGDDGEAESPARGKKRKHEGE
ncbi:CLUMA_CG016234, isoform A [Clunio marinus]|uniref:CLUMA_CG016234, isoform A n=1 Tax=Clunio marinus TaxID=568069 RepID=A0A1J1ITY6_9DIPT|nr:CLUMA_CG016234, isoform A [Clunio marinus]